MKKPQDGLRVPRQGRPETEAFVIYVDGEAVSAYPGETIAAALYAAGRRAWHKARGGGPRGLLCGIGVCFDCLVTVDGLPNVRACQALAQPGMQVVTDMRSEQAS